MEMKYALPGRRWSGIVRVSVPPQAEGEAPKPYWKRVDRVLKVQHPEMLDAIASIVAEVGYFDTSVGSYCPLPEARSSFEITSRPDVESALAPGDSATISAIYEDLLPPTEIPRADESKERTDGRDR